MDAVKLRTQYPWLDTRIDHINYLDPAYYDRILMPYVFDGRNDLELFGDFLKTLPQKADGKILEIGPGTGRATDVLLRNLPEKASLDLIDQSERMLSSCVSRFGGGRFRNLLLGDALQTLQVLEDQYDCIFSLWSFSHSIHQKLQENPSSEETLAAQIERNFGRLLNAGGRFYVMHFDALSTEQRISLRQRRRKFEFFIEGEQSPSLRILQRAFDALEASGQMEYELQRHSGDAITYKTIGHALEVFMNFHMEGKFNDCPYTEEVVTALRNDLSALTLEDGRIAVETGCFVFSGRKIN